MYDSVSFSSHVEVTHIIPSGHFLLQLCVLGLDHHFGAHLHYKQDSTIAPNRRFAETVVAITVTVLVTITVTIITDSYGYVYGYGYGYGYGYSQR